MPNRAPVTLAIPWDHIRNQTATEYAEGVLAQLRQANGGDPETNPYTMPTLSGDAWEAGYRARLHYEDSPGMLDQLLDQLLEATTDEDRDIARENIKQYAQSYIDRFVNVNTQLASLKRAVAQIQV